MSLLTKHGRITVKPFAKVPALGDLPEINPAPPTVSNVSSGHGAEDGVDLAEGCLVTNTVKYTHQLVHWVNGVRPGDPGDIESVLAFDLRIIPYRGFKLNDVSNLAFLEASVHTSLDLYAFIAVTPSSSTLDGLIDMVRSDNLRRQTELDTTGHDPDRSLNFSVPSFVTPEYELVAMHPEHFLPPGNVLAVCDPKTKMHKVYVAARDRVLRESVDPSSPRFPPFRHVSQNRYVSHRLNVFLVALNAEIKFRRYMKLDPPAEPLPDDVLNLMKRTIELMELLYWEPVPTKGSVGEKVYAATIAHRRQNPYRGARLDPTKAIEKISSDEEEMGAGGNVQSLGRGGAFRKFPWPEGADLETRMAIGRAMMCGHDRDYDPKLFEGAYPINESHLYGDKETVAAWCNSVLS